MQFKIIRSDKILFNKRIFEIEDWGSQQDTAHKVITNTA